MDIRKGQLKHLVHGAIFGLVIVAFLAFMVACGNKDGGRRIGIAGGTYAGVISGAACPGCPSGSKLYDAALGYTQDGATQMVLHMYTDQNAVQGGSGQVYASGQLILSQPLSCQSAFGGGMGLTAGVYTINTFSMGNYNDNLFSGLHLVAQNGFNQAELYIDVGYVNEATPKLSVCTHSTGLGAIYNELVTSAFVTSINGFPCTINVSTMVPRGAQLCH